VAQKYGSRQEHLCYSINRINAAKKQQEIFLAMSAYVSLICSSSFNVLTEDRR
jgi:hypothetical protein